MAPPVPRPDIDPALAARLESAGPAERIEALLLLRPEAASRAAMWSDLPDVVRNALGSRSPADVTVRVFASLGALFVAGPADVVRRLLADPEIASATLPDRSE